jgi:hypothetical protein
MAGPCPTPRIAIVAVAIFGFAEAQVVGEEASPRRERVLSPRLSSALSSQLPKYSPDTSVPASPDGVAVPRNEIIRLPKYIVRAPRPPSAEDMLTKEGREDAAATRYLGSPHGLDRSMNRHTLVGLWQSIPVLGRIPFVPFGSQTNGQRALEQNERKEAKRKFSDLLDLEAFAQAVEKEAAQKAAPNPPRTPNSSGESAAAPSR